MPLREFHIWDLPENKIFIDIDDNFREELIKLAKRKFGGAKSLSKILNVEINNIWKWSNGISKWKGKISRRFVPLNHFLNICDLINNSNFSKKKLEENVIAFRG